MTMLEIRLVRVGRTYVGADVSSRWSLVTLFGTDVVGADRNQRELKARRREAGSAFKLTVVRGSVIQWAATVAERMALGTIQAVRFGRLAA